MNIPKQKFNFMFTKKLTPHTKEEMKFVCENQEFMDVEDWKSIKDGTRYIVQLIGWSYEAETIDDPSGTVFNNWTKFYKVFNVWGGIEEMDFDNFEEPRYLATDGSVYSGGVKTKLVWKFSGDKTRPEHKNVNWQK